MTRQHRWIAAAGLLVVACGGSDEGQAWHPNAGAAGGSGAGLGGEAGSGGVAGAGGATGHGGAAGQGGGAAGQGGGAAGAASNTLYPLKTGASWTYNVTSVGGGTICATGERTSQVLGPKSVGGKDGFEVTGWCSASSSAQLIAPGAGDEVFFYFNEEWFTLLDGNLTEGHSWSSYFDLSFRWKKEGAVTVPAGTYNDCWSAVQNVSYTAYTTYCRGVGPVRSYSSDLNGSGWDAQLTATTM